LDVPECTVCHDNHGIQHPTPELFHGGSAPEIKAGKITGLDPFAAELGDLAAGALTSATWKVVLRPHVAADDKRLVHRVEVSAEGVEPLTLDATVRAGVPPGDEVQAATPALAAKLTISPVAGLPVEAGDALVVRLEVQAGGAPVKGVKVKDLPGEAIVPVAGSACRTCHTEGDACDEATGKMYVALSTLDKELREAAAVLHRAEVAGMEVSAPQFELKSKGATAEIEARALVHSFDPGRLVARSEEGRKTARSALDAGRAALAELQVRRKGLAASLVLVGLVLLGLYLKMRQIDRLRGGEALTPPL